MRKKKENKKTFSSFVDLVLGSTIKKQISSSECTLKLSQRLQRGRLEGEYWKQGEE